MILKYVELHSPLFLAGTNYQLKLDTGRYSQLSIKYDSSSGWVVATAKNPKSGEPETAYIPLSNVASMVEATAPKSAKAEPVYPAQRIKAQVGAPPGIKID